MSREDVVYMLLLFGAIPFGHLVKISGSPSRKQFLALFAGLVMIVATSGFRGIVHSFCTILGTFLILKIAGPRYGPWSAFLYVFGYLFFFRTCHWYGLPQPPPYSNAVQLLVTLRMCTIAFEGFQLSCKNRPRKLEEITANSKLQVSLYDTFSYGYSYCGLMTGPYYRLTTYVDMLHQTKPIPTLNVVLQRLKHVPFLAAIYIPLNAYFPVSHLTSMAFENHSWGTLYQIAYLIPLFGWFRLRFYIGWLLAESSCLSMALGAYPEECKCRPGQGPTVEFPEDKKIEKYDFETIRNIRLWETEFAPTLHKTTKTWNMTVQWWLAQYFYKKFPFKQHRMWATFLFSAFWHGVRPGYYLTFMSVPLVILAQSLMEKLIQPSVEWKTTYDWINWLILHRCFEYLSVAFILLDINAIIQTWTQMYFYNHIMTLFFILLAFILMRKKTNEHGVKLENGKKNS
ncbi:lysophospholipid acyltransferase 7-like [Dendronephthya gigantea]|uniref:lysophospholipid acyltransferase 7-like n=1 Tax=Dendronephthya gigantea TaxID=151771 RepID=UPI00106BB2A2|nr:lysophospholipid acyltransferase 7-like [Dendronephthya gigantea]